jgi:hypothetical protein
LVELVTKAAVGLSGLLGVVVAPVLSQFADQPAAQTAVDNGTILIPEMQPLYSRWGIMLPLITGIPSLVVGLFADKWLEKRPNLQLGLLNYGVTATTGGSVELARAVSARTQQGMSAFSPTDAQAEIAVSDFCPVRGIGYYAAPKPAADVAPCGGSAPPINGASGAGASARARRRSRSVVA